MTKTIRPGERAGAVRIPASKSQAHRALICAALSDKPVKITCGGISDDIAATAQCIEALGGRADISGDVIDVSPVPRCPGGARQLYCRESGSTLRFMLPLAGALGADADFHMEGRLPERPLSPLKEQLCAHGMSIERLGDILSCRGRLEAGTFELPGNISSQYITGLLMALPVLGGQSALRVVPPVESEGYIAMTEDVIRLGGIRYTKTGYDYVIPGGQIYCFPDAFAVEGDWSSAAFFLCAGALSDKGVTVSGLDMSSSQGDRRIFDILSEFGARISAADGTVSVRRSALSGITIDARMVPDIIPVLSVVAAAAEGTTRIINAGRLRLKESDRIHSVAVMLSSLGGTVSETEDGLIITGTGGLRGGSVDSFRDHRIAMSAAVAACISREDVSVSDPGCTAKSYPRFWGDFEGLEVIP